jgi:D-alanyl-D-alanine endopeptidase (penicillin-binding protein 7)
MLALILSLFFLALRPSFLETPPFSLSLDITSRPQINFSSPYLWSGEQKSPLKKTESLGPYLKARSALVVDVGSGRILFQKNAQKIYPIASLTKLMTAYLFLANNPGWSQEVTMQSQDEEEGGRLFVQPGDKLLVRDLFNSLLIGSANNAAKALVRVSSLSEEEFVKEMNKQAARWSLNNTHFQDVTGLGVNNVSTAYDLARLAYHVFQVKEISQTSIKTNYEFDLINRTSHHFIKNTDKLVLKNKYKIKGSKTGFINEALYCLLLEVEGEKGQKIIIVLLGAPDADTRFQEAENLILWTWANFEW